MTSKLKFQMVKVTYLVIGKCNSSYRRTLVRRCYSRNLDDQLILKGTTCWYPEFFQKTKKNIQPTVLWYSVSHNFIYPYLFAGNQGNHQNFVPILVPIDLWWIWIRTKQIYIYFFLEKKIQNGRLKNTEFFNYPQKLSDCRQNFIDWSLA